MKVAVITGSRADYGLLRPTLAALSEQPDFELCLLVTAMHLHPSYGDTLAEIAADGHAIAARVEAGARVGDRGDFARNIGHATIAFSDALADARPDLLLVLGDRFEIVAGALAAASLGIPVAHIHGGELSEGSLDDSLRHCITKLSHIHFVATRTYAERVCQLGEDPDSVHIVGAAALESIAHLPLLEEQELARALGLEQLRRPLLALTLHPASLAPEAAGAQAEAVIGAVEDLLHDSGSIVVSLPNDDPGSPVIHELLSSWGARRANVHVFATLGQRRYLSLLRCADLVLGNSSSAIIEAPSFRVPVVNVGDRQRGRLMAANVIGAGAQRPAVAAAMRRALDPAFRASLSELENPYDHGDVAMSILETLRRTPLEGLTHKRFFDLPDCAWRTELELRAPPRAGAYAS
ncbi:MAG TPA: UDP-N-acetylglucosamine 2-epimerase [Solirubrobacteraceae bacterium]|nr:UDP-N-acetylglucosamine 2-epimerase [Solirubrobacteraceae bacterium]